MMVVLPSNHLDLRRQLLDPSQVMMAAVPGNHFQCNSLETQI
ncbi:MAG TPA: hypothetical protein VMV33_00845 [Rhodocyclaceae bacterium]|nr:hypothetical protein [Rhodocyclaceae bacterium]